MIKPESFRAEKEPGRAGEAFLTFGNRVIRRHAIFSLTVVLVYLLLNRPEVIMVSQLGFTVWFPAAGLILAVMLGIFRGEDVVCRYSGEEFAFILPESSAKNAAKRVEQLRQVAKKHKITYKERVMDAVTFSVGIAAYPKNGLTGEELLQTADTCLYESKANGRGRVTIATSPKS